MGAKEPRTGSSIYTISNRYFPQDSANIIKQYDLPHCAISSINKPFSHIAEKRVYFICAEEGVKACLPD